MNRAKRTDLVTTASLFAIALAILLHIVLGSTAQEQSQETSQVKEVTYEDYNGKKIGIATGTNLEAESFKYFPRQRVPLLRRIPRSHNGLGERHHRRLPPR